MLKSQSNNICCASNKLYSHSKVGNNVEGFELDSVSQVRNAFCAIRPPGHHAGPLGTVTSALDPHGSQGFCFLNNIAIAGAYAMSTYRHQGESSCYCLRTKQMHCTCPLLLCTKSPSIEDSQGYSLRQPSLSVLCT